jgi:hypothetical protein
MSEPITMYVPENETLFYWGMHTCCEKDVPTVREVTDPLIQLARDYLKEPKNGVMRDLATNGTLTRDPRGIMETTVKDFVCYVAHRLQTSLRRDAWEEDKAR